MSEFTEFPIPRRNAATDAAARTALQNALVTNAAVASAIGSDAGAIRTAANAERAATFNVLDFGAIGNGTADDTEAIQDALDAADNAGGGVVYVPASDDPYIVTDALEIGARTTLRGDGPGSIIKKDDDSGDSGIIVNKGFPDAGHPGIAFEKIHLDGNNEEHPDGYYNVAEFRLCPGIEFRDVWVRGGKRKDQTQPQALGKGQGVLIRQCHGWSVVGGYFYENDYDGFKPWGSDDGVMVGTRFHDNGRSGIQMSFDRVPGGTSHDLAHPGSARNVISGIVVTHSDGNSGDGAPYNSGVAIHSGSHNTVVGASVYGTQAGVDMLEGAHHNLIIGGRFAVRPGASWGTRFPTAIFLWQGNRDGGIQVYANEFRTCLFRVLTGTSEPLMFFEGAKTTRIKDCVFERDGATGAWELVLDDETEDNEIEGNIFRDFDVVVDDDGLRNKIRISAKVGILDDAANIAWNTLRFPNASVTLEGNREIAINNHRAGESYMLRVAQDATGNRTITWPDAVVWPDDTSPTLSTSANESDLFRFESDGQNIFGSVVGKGYQAQVVIPSSGVEEFDAGSETVPAGWTERFVTSGVTWEETTGGFLRAAKSTTGRTMLAWDILNNAEDIEILAKVRSSVLTTATATLVAVRGSGAAGNESAYVAGLSRSGSNTLVAINKYVDGTAGGLNVTNYSWTVDTWHWLRFRVSGSLLQLRAWADGDTEPSGWSTQFTDSDISGPGWAGCFVFPEGNFDWDYFSYALNGGTAPGPA